MNLAGIGYFLIQGPFFFIGTGVLAITFGLGVSDEWFPWYSVLAMIACWHFGATCIVVGRLLAPKKRRSVAWAVHDRLPSHRNKSRSRL